MRYNCGLIYLYEDVRLSDGQDFDQVEVEYDFSVNSLVMLNRVVDFIRSESDQGKFVVYKEIKGYARINIRIHSDCPDKSLPAGLRDIEETDAGSGSQG